MYDCIHTSNILYRKESFYRPAQDSKPNNRPSPPPTPHLPQKVLSARSYLLASCRASMAICCICRACSDMFNDTFLRRSSTAHPSWSNLSWASGSSFFRRSMISLALATSAGGKKNQNSCFLN